MHGLDQIVAMNERAAQKELDERSNCHAGIRLESRDRKTTVWVVVSPETNVPRAAFSDRGDAVAWARRAFNQARPLVFGLALDQPLDISIYDC